MLPVSPKPRRSHPLATWLRRVGPARSLSLILGALTLLLLGCYAITERVSWRRTAPDDRPPEITMNRMVRVRLLGRKPKAATRLAITCPFEIARTASGHIDLHRTERLPACTVRPNEAGGISIGPIHFEHDDILITPKRDASLVVEGKTYRGLLRIKRSGDGLVFTNHVDIESYLRGVLRGELPRDFHPEGFKAQCVAARTYVLYQMRFESGERSFDVFDNEASQMYLGVRGENRKAVDAVEQTRGQVCIWNDDGRDTLFCTYYSSACGGRSQHVNSFKPSDPSVPPLAGDVVCNDCYLARFYRWSPVKISKTDLTKRIVARYSSIGRIGEIVGLRPKVLTPDGRIVRIQLDGAGGRNETLVGEDFRLSIGGHRLKSTNFVIETGPDHFIFKEGKGFGHGVGLCQHGMETKARRGMKYDDILAFYYPSSTIKTLYN